MTADAQRLRLVIALETEVRVRFWDAVLALIRDANVEVQWYSLREPGAMREVFPSVFFAAMECKSAWEYPGAVWRMRRLLREFRPHLVLGIEPIISTILFSAARLAGRPGCLFNRQNTEPVPKQKWLSRAAAHMADLTMAVSQAAVDWMVEHERVPRSRAIVTWNGVPELRKVDAGEVAAIRQKLGIEADAAVIGMVARVREIKGYTELFDAADAIAAAVGRPLHLVMVGTGPDEARFREYSAAKVKTAKVHWVGYFDDVAPWYAASDVQAMPSYMEGLPLAGVEAMAAGKPIVASAAGGLKELVVDGETGILVPPRDAAALGRALAEVLRSPELGKKMGAVGYERYREHFAIEAMVRKWLGGFERVIAERGIETPWRAPSVSGRQ